MIVNQKLVQALLNGKIAVIPTDTIYGIVACAKKPASCEKIYSLKKRATTKACIILISSPRQILDFGVDKKWISKTSKYWPGPNSLIIPTIKKDIAYLTRGGDSLAFRLPDSKDLISLIDKTGPLIAPSANPESMPPATNIAQAKKYFGNLVDIYVDKGECFNTSPSRLIDLSTGQILR